VDQLSGARAFNLDPAGRITAVQGQGWTERYAYDSAGNIISATWPTDDTESTGERVYAGTLIRRAGNTRYQHDAQGRVIMRQRKRLTAKPLTWHYTWDADDRLTDVTTPDGQRWCYRYDPLGRRVAKQRIEGDRVAEQTEFTWDGVVLAEQAQSTGKVTTWDWEPDSFRPVTQTERTALSDAPQQWIDEQFYSIVTDLIGTPSELVDPHGTIAWHSRTTLWGALLSSTPTSAHTPLRFPGQYHDPETGLNYNYHRYYDPTTGRYDTTDPLGLIAGPNPRTYVVNPTLWLDPLGLSPYNRFPQTADEMTEKLAVSPTKVTTTPDGTPRVIWEPSDHIRIRMESHPEGLSLGDSGFNPRHHGTHFHVETRADPSLSWNNKNNVTKILPPGYAPGSGTAFLPGELFP
jgi:RHS repeat-associated protein